MTRNKEPIFMKAYLAIEVIYIVSSGEIATKRKINQVTRVDHYQTF